jgi:hypothetical protein
MYVYKLGRVTGQDVFEAFEGQGLHGSELFFHVRQPCGGRFATHWGGVAAHPMTHWS